MTGFRPVFDYRAADYINPDVTCGGGILELLEIAAMDEPYFVAVSPHNYISTLLGLTPTVHASACLPNFIITEYFPWRSWNWEVKSARFSPNPWTATSAFPRIPAWAWR